MCWQDPQHKPEYNLIGRETCMGDHKVCVCMCECGGGGGGMGLCLCKCVWLCKCMLKILNYVLIQRIRFCINVVVRMIMIT